MNFVIWWGVHKKAAEDLAVQFFQLQKREALHQSRVDLQDLCKSLLELVSTEQVKFWVLDLQLRTCMGFYACPWSEKLIRCWILAPRPGPSAKVDEIIAGGPVLLSNSDLSCLQSAAGHKSSPWNT